MEYTKLGRTGLDVSRICLGCMSYGEGDRGNHAWSLGEEESRPFIKRALEAGINFFGGPQQQEFFRKGGRVKGTSARRGPTCVGCDRAIHPRRRLHRHCAVRALERLVQQMLCRSNSASQHRRRGFAAPQSVMQKTWSGQPPE
jgi:hypothetical protein